MNPTFVENDPAENQSLAKIESAILTPEARAFLLKLAARFEPRRQELLARRRTVQQELDAGRFPHFLPETAAIRQADWKVARIPKDLRDRRVEITGPVDRKMIINALNSGANVFMADFEDSNSPTWANIIEGQINLHDAIDGTIDFNSPEGKQYKLDRQNRRRCWCGRAAGTWTKSTSWWTASRFRHALRFRPVLLPQRRKL